MAINFNNADYVDVPAHASINNLGPVTVSWWSYITSMTAEKRTHIAVKRADATNYSYFARFADYEGASQTNMLELKIYYSSQELTVMSEDNTVPTDGWYHWILTWDGSTTATNVHMYRNNSELSYQTQQDGSGDRGDDTSGLFRFGAILGHEFNGQLTELAVWDVVVSSATRTALYGSGNPKKGIPGTLETGNLALYLPMDDNLSGSIIEDTVRDLSSNSNNGTGKDDGGLAVWSDEPTNLPNIKLFTGVSP